MAGTFLLTTHKLHFHVTSEISNISLPNYNTALPESSSNNSSSNSSNNNSDSCFYPDNDMNTSETIETLHWNLSTISGIYRLSNYSIILYYTLLYHISYQISLHL